MRHNLNNIEYDWDFGDGMTTSGDNVQYGFEYFGDYEVSLKATISEYEKESTLSVPLSQAYIKAVMTTAKLKIINLGIVLS